MRNRRASIGLILSLVGICALLGGPWASVHGEDGARPIDIRVDPRRGERAVRLSTKTVASLDQALVLVRLLRQRWPERPITIELAPGLHRVSHPLRIGPEESGSAMAPLTIRGAPGRRSVVVGSIAIPPAATILDRALAARLPEAAKAHVRTYRLPETALLGARIQQPKLLRSPPDALALAVYDAQGELHPARWPNEGWAKVGTVFKDAASPGFTLDAERLAQWSAEPDLWAEGHWRWGWLYESLPVSRVDPGAKRIDLTELPYEGILPGAKIRITHALSELNAPGEWWRDKADGLLLAWPRPGDETLDVAVTDTVFSFENASHVRIETLTLEHSRGDLVTVRGGGDIVIRDSRLAFASGRGAVFLGAKDSGLENCDIEDIGRVGVWLDAGDRAALEPGGDFLRDSRITRFALRSRTQSPAVMIGGVGALVSGNMIHDGIDAAMHIHGNEHRIVNNEIARLLAGTTDDGAIYAGRDWTARGTRIEGNFIHDIKADAGAEVKGVYLDDEASGFTVRGNLFLRVDQAVFIGGGRDNAVEDNVFVASSPAIHVDSRGQTWAAGAIGDPHSELRTAFAAMPVASPIWRAHYPGLADLLLDRPEVAKANRLENNLFVLSGDIHIDDGGAAGEQIIRDNAGPETLRLRSGGDLAVLARDSTNPEDFSGLVDQDGRPAIRLDLAHVGQASGPLTR